MFIFFFNAASDSEALLSAGDFSAFSISFSAISPMKARSP
jgi:hypothetical protein